MRDLEQVGIVGLNPEKSGQQRVGCPKCSPTRHKYWEMCLSVNIEEQAWYCWHCGWTGRIRDKQVIQEENKFKILEPITKELTDDFYAWFNSRGISRATVDLFSIKLASIKTRDGIRKAMAFPFYLGYNVVNYKFRTLAKEFKQAAGVEHTILFNINASESYDEIIITEGEIDALSIAEVGMENVMSVPAGAPPADATSVATHLQYISNSIERLIHVKKFILAVDNDGPGRRLQEELARRLGKSKCYIVKYPTGCKDANDVLVKVNREKLIEIISNAEPYPQEGVYSVKEYYDEVVDIYESGFPAGRHAKLSPEFDELMSFLPGQLTVVTGIPNSGKSPFMDQLLLNMAIHNGQKSVVFSPENGTIPIHISRLVRQYTGKHILPNMGNRATPSEFYAGLEFINDHIQFVYPKDNSFTLSNILDKFTYVIQKYGAEYAAIDPWNTLDHHYGGNNTSDYIGTVLNQIKYYAREMGVHFFVVAHPTKMYKDERTNMYDVPTMYSISGSANWFNVPENGLSIYRRFAPDFKTTQWTEVYVQKVKFDFVGKIGMCKFQFNVNSQLFHRYDDDLSNNIQQPRKSNKPSWQGDF